MGCEQVCLKWNNFSWNITKNIDDLWKDESLVDVSLISDGQCIQAHKVILSASSPLFKSLFAVNPCQHPVIILQDVRFRELVSIITFIYKGEVNIFEESLPALLQAAKTLQIRGLSDSVDRDSLNRLYALRSEESERAAKKRRTGSGPVPAPTPGPGSGDGGGGGGTAEPTAPDECTPPSDADSIVPKEEPKADGFGGEYLSTASDEDDVKAEELTLGGAELAPTDDASDNRVGFPCPFCWRTYANWGFRRRHVYSVHCGRALPCKWCSSIGEHAPLFELTTWAQHARTEHTLAVTHIDALLLVYKEAEAVLQATGT